MTEWLQVAFLALLIILLYIISSRWRPGDQSQRAMRLSYWIGLAVAALILALIAIVRLRNV